MAGCVGLLTGAACLDGNTRGTGGDIGGVGVNTSADFWRSRRIVFAKRFDKFACAG